jgi:hypothetical protein
VDPGVAVLAVLVTYERPLAEVEAWPVLAALLARDRGLSSPLAGLLVYDNSTTPRTAETARIKGCVYMHNPRNGGTAAAYTQAAAVAREAGVQWLLLLDQDTRVTEGFLEAVAGALGRSRNNRLDALVPWVVQDGVPVSPATISRLGTIRPLAGGAAAQPARPLTAIASGSVIRVATLEAMMPFPGALWLDYVDHWIFLQIHGRGGMVEVLNCELEHDLSVSSLQTMSRQRLLSILNGEREFFRLLARVPRAIYPLRVAVRTLRYLAQRPQLAQWVCAWVRETATAGKP